MDNCMGQISFWHCKGEQIVCVTISAVQGKGLIILVQIFSIIIYNPEKITVSKLA